MRLEVDYEWCREVTDEHGDIIENNFSETLSPLWNDEGDLVLVRSTGNNDEGVVDRHWAYVRENSLPEYFSDAMGEPTPIKVPKRFHDEILKAHKTSKAKL